MDWDLPVTLPASMPDFRMPGLAASGKVPLPRSYAIPSSSLDPVSFFSTIETTAEPDSYDDLDLEPHDRQPDPPSFPSSPNPEYPTWPAAPLPPEPSGSPNMFARRPPRRASSRASAPISELSRARANAAASAALAMSGLPSQTKEKKEGKGKYNTIPAVAIALCSNCGTEKSSLWRRNSADGEPLCNGGHESSSEAVGTLTRQIPFARSAPIVPRLFIQPADSSSNSTEPCVPCR